jgi:transposase InsO family protein
LKSAKTLARFALASYHSQRSVVVGRPSPNRLSNYFINYCRASHWRISKINWIALEGSQFTSNTFTGILKEHEIAISMDGRGRALDNIFVERLWRSVKYEDVYIRDYETAPQAIAGLGRYFKFYNGERLHQSLDYKTPEAVYRLTA